MKAIWIHFLMLVSMKFNHAQDIHFTQFWDANSYSNPSMIGSFDGSMRVCGIFRSQWSQFNTPLQTIYGEVNFKIPSKENYFSVGISGLNDKLEFLGYNQNRMYASISYQQQLSNIISIGAGFQVGVRMTSMDYSKLTFDRQWNPNTGSFDPANSSFEKYTGETQTTPMINLGVNINILQGEVLHTFDVGFNQINTPYDFYYNSNQRIPIKYSLNYHGYFPIKESWTLMPKVNGIFSNNANSLLYGCLVKYKLNNLQYIYGGCLMRWGLDRNGDAFTPTIGYKFNAMKIGFSYDQNFSGLSSQSLKNAYEITLVYILSPVKPKYFSIDCMRL